MAMRTVYANYGESTHDAHNMHSLSLHAKLQHACPPLSSAACLDHIVSKFNLKLNMRENQLKKATVVQHPLFEKSRSTPAVHTPQPIPQIKQGGQKLINTLQEQQYT
jgi:hypothetical protein